MRGGTKIRFWTPGFRNKPSVEPPGLLRIVSALSICSLVGFLVYAVAVTLGSHSVSIEARSAAYVAGVHFVLPLGIAYTITTNSPYSRHLIFAYSLVMYTAVLGGWGYFGSIRVGLPARLAVSTAAFLLVLWWLFRSPRMRYYYALISDRPVPEDLQSRAAQLAGRNWLSPRTKAVIEWMMDNLEIIVMVGFIIVVIYAYLNAY